MLCLKCGKDTNDKQVFCDGCLQAMESYPVKPGTPVHLPKTQAPSEAKKAASRKRPLTTDEQIASLHRHLRRARVFGLILAALLLAASGLLVYEILNPDGPVIGLNYTIDTTMGTD